MLEQNLSTAYNNPRYKRSLLAEARALAAVSRREWRIFLRYPSWVVAVLIWPLIFPATYILAGRALAGPDNSALDLFRQYAGTDDYIGYIAIGTTIWMWQNMVLWNIGFTLRSEQLRGTLESNWMSPAWRFSLLLGHSFIDLITTIIFMTITVLEFSLFFGVRFNGSLPLALLIILAAIPSIYGLGFAFASLVITAKEANSFVFLVRGLVMIFAGITYPIILMPEWMQEVARWIPATYVIDGLRRAALSGASIQELMPSLISLLLFGLFWLAAGYLVFLFMERQARKKGSIGQY